MHKKIAEKDPDKYKHIWLAYDKDDFPKDDLDNTYSKCKSLSGNGNSVIYHALWSNNALNTGFCCILCHWIPHFIETSIIPS